MKKTILIIAAISAVALLNNGTEEHKGNELTKQAYELLKQSGLNFIGNVEARDLITGAADVIVADGFSGNVQATYTF